MSATETTEAASNGGDSVDEQAAAIAGGVSDASFTMELSQDQKDIREWVHG